MLVALVCAGLGPPASARADVPAAQVGEVEHLLEFIRNSSCKFVRNGNEHDGERAFRHVMRKYDYFRDQIRSTEDFIDLAASRSEMSGRAYLFRCDGKESESRTMLLAELERFRAHTAAAGGE